MVTRLYLVIVYQMAGSNATETISDLEKVLAKAQESLPTG